MSATVLPYCTKAVEMCPGALCVWKMLLTSSPGNLGDSAQPSRAPPAQDVAQAPGDLLLCLFKDPRS